MKRVPGKTHPWLEIAKCGIRKPRRAQVRRWVGDIDQGRELAPTLDGYRCHFPTEPHVDGQVWPGTPIILDEQASDRLSNSPPRYCLWKTQAKPFRLIRRTGAKRSEGEDSAR